MEYSQFIENKRKRAQQVGFEVEELNSNLFPFQSHIVRKALKIGRYAIFADCGLGKTLMQLEWAHRVCDHTGGSVLILCPLAVSGQTIAEGDRFGIQVSRLKDGDEAVKGIYITNYEQLDNIDCSQFAGVVLDESSILKNFNGKLRNKIIEGFAQTNYKLACTATPSPNDPMELGNHSEFLNQMTRNEMLAMYFVHDGGETSKWRLKGHAKKAFYSFVSTWATMIANPSDIGFDGSNYVLPSIKMCDRVVETEQIAEGQLFNDIAVNATNFNAELRRTMAERMELAASIANSTKDQYIVWVKQNEEGDLVTSMIDGAIQVKGSDSIEHKERCLLGFARSEFRVLVTKTKIAQFGLNYQNCHRQIFASIDFSFEGLYQAIRRSYRFGQKNNVIVDIITTDTMANVIESIKEKQSQFNEMQKQMSASVGEFNKSEANVMSVVKENGDWTAINGDCVEQIKTIKSESIGFSVFSPPFSELYTYSSYANDMGNSKDYDEFENHFKYLLEDLYRIMMQGRNVAVHCMDLPIQKGKEGYIGLRDFSGMLIKWFQDVGFVYHSRVTIWKDPVVEMQRTKALGLLHKQIKKDSTMSRVGIPDYILIFRKDGDRENPVRNTDLPVDLWQKYASPVWMDINYNETLNRTEARQEEDEKHICPLQLPTIERLVHLYSNKGDLVFSPFMGIGSEGYQSLKMGRRFVGIELKPSYYDTAIKNLKMAEMENNQLTLL